MIPFGEFLPDQPALGNPGATEAKNCVPKTKGSYGPFPGLNVVTDALTARCQGAHAVRDQNGDVQEFAGDATKLYQRSGTSWTDVSGATYTTASDGYWRFVGSGIGGTARVIATNFADAIQNFDLATDTQFSDLSANAPKARAIGIIYPGFVMVGNTWDSTDGFQPQRVWWPAIDDPTDWPTPGSADAASKQSDFQDMIEGGYVQAIVGAVGGSAGAVLTDSTLYRVDYTQSDTVFAFTPIERSRGTFAPNSTINVGPLAFYLSEDGFRAFDGSQSIPIGDQKIDNFVLDDLTDVANNARIYAAASARDKLVYWAYSNAATGNPNKIVIYNWEINQWSWAEVDTQLIYQALTASLTLEDLDAYGTMETLPYSLDSRAWQGGQITAGGFDATNKQGLFTGSNLAAVLESTEYGRDDGRRLFIKAIRGLVDGGTVTISTKWRDTPDGSYTTNSATAVGSDGTCPQRQSCRYARAQVNIAASGSWTHAQGIEPDMMPEGTR